MFLQLNTGPQHNVVSANGKKKTRLLWERPTDPG